MRFNRVPEKVPEKVRFNTVSEKVPEKVWEALVQSQVRRRSTGFRKRFRRRFRRRFQEVLVQSQVRFNGFRRRFRRRPAEPGQIQHGFGEGSGEGLGGFGAESGEGSGGLRGFGAEPGQVQQGSGEGSGEVSRNPWCKAKSDLTGFGEGCREGPGEGFGNVWARSGLTGSTGFPALGLAARFTKNCKDKTLRLLGIPPKLIFLPEPTSRFGDDRRFWATLARREIP